MHVLGIDLAKRTFDATLLTAAGLHQHATFANTAAGFTALAAWLTQHQVSAPHLCMEATNIYWKALATWAHAQGYTVSVVNPARIKGHALATLQRNKTDKLDSAVIADFCRVHHPEAWQPLTAAQEQLQALVRHRDDLLQTQLQQQNRLRDTTDAGVRRSLEAVLAVVASQLRSVEQTIKDLMQTTTAVQAEVALLTSIVGIGLVTAHKLLAELPNLRGYHSAKAAAADVGVTPSQYESGTSVRRRPRMSKVGKADVRAALWWPAITAMRCCPGFQAFAATLAKRGKAKKVIIVAVMRKLMHVIYGVLKHQTPYDPAKAFGWRATP